MYDLVLPTGSVTTVPLKCKVALAQASRLRAIENLLIKGAWHSFRSRIFIPYYAQ